MCKGMSHGAYALKSQCQDIINLAHDKAIFTDTWAVAK